MPTDQRDVEEIAGLTAFDSRGGPLYRRKLRFPAQAIVKHGCPPKIIFSIETPNEAEAAQHERFGASAKIAERATAPKICPVMRYWWSICLPPFYWKVWTMANSTTTTHNPAQSSPHPCASLTKSLGWSLCRRADYTTVVNHHERPLNTFWARVRRKSDARTDRQSFVSAGPPRFYPSRPPRGHPPLLRTCQGTRAWAIP
jgi:hypothetical protein